MTGASERPSRSTPETRKADKGSSSTARTALKALHAAERSLMSARHKSEMQRTSSDVAARTALGIGAKAQGITAHYAAKVTALGKELTDDQRAAEIAQLKLEEAAELGHMYMKSAREGEALRRAAMGPIKTRHKTDRHQLSRRHRAERAAIAVMLRTGQRRPTEQRHARLAVRYVAKQLLGTRR